jgi:HEAT repeat protein
MAVPSGRYELTASVDLSPVFGILEHNATVDVVIPGPDAINDHLKSLASEDKNVRRTALIALRYFKEDAERVVPALLTCVKDPELNIRTIALSVLMSFQTQAKEHLDVFMKILSGGKDVDFSEKSMAVQALCRLAPSSDEVDAAMVKALAESPENYKALFESQLKRYRQRTKRE